MGLRIERNKDHLPRDLFQRGSDLDKMVTLAQDAVEANTFGANSTLRTTRNQLRLLCPQYRPGARTANEVLCHSGEDNGLPYRAECGRCHVGQFSAKGMFIGEIVPASVLAQAL